MDDCSQAKSDDNKSNIHNTSKDKKLVDSTVEPDVDVVDASIDESVDEESALVAVGATDVNSAIASLNDPKSAFYSSLKGADFETKKIIAKAQTTSEPIDLYLNETILLTNVIVVPVDLLNKETGEINKAPRVILIDAENKAYHGTSIGLMTAVKNLFSTLGEPSEWPEPVALKVVEQKGNNGFKFFTFNLV